MAELETYLTLQEATDKYKISAEVLTQLASSGKIRAVRLNGNGGGIAVAERDVKEQAEEVALKPFFRINLGGKFRPVGERTAIAPWPRWSLSQARSGVVR